MPHKCFQKSWLVACVIPGVLSGFLAMSTGVNDAQAAQYATSKSPYWRVGVINKNLSALCQKRLFNQVRRLNLHIGYLGKVGKGVTGVAQKYWNLKDPTNIGVDGLTYHFFNDGFSNCKVFTAGKPGRR
ncbi:MAG: hypothetical protein ACKVHL_09085 [Rhodospirillales bacterium]|jgi:hypothetical protein